jgi:hypothetical protein
VGPFQNCVRQRRRQLKFHPPFFLFLAWRPSWLKVGITGHTFGRGLKCEMLTDGRQTKSDDRVV